MLLSPEAYLDFLYEVITQTLAHHQRCPLIQQQQTFITKSTKSNFKLKLCLMSTFFAFNNAMTPKLILFSQSAFAM